MRAHAGWPRNRRGGRRHRHRFNHRTAGMRVDGGDRGQLDLRTGACLRSGKRFVDLPCGAQSGCITTRWGHRRQRQPFARLAGSRTLSVRNFTDDGIGAGKRNERHRHHRRPTRVRLDRHERRVVDHDHLECQRQRQRHRVLQRGSEQQRRKPLRHDGDRQPDIHRQPGRRSVRTLHVHDRCSEPAHRSYGRRRYPSRGHGAGRMRVDGREQRAMDHGDLRRHGQRQRVDHLHCGGQHRRGAHWHADDCGPNIHGHTSRCRHRLRPAPM